MESTNSDRRREAKEISNGEGGTNKEEIKNVK
jgi:hypothetical protein